MHIFLLYRQKKKRILLFAEKFSPACIILLVSLLPITSLYAQQYDLLIKNGHLIDAKNQINEVRDIAVKDGKVAKVAASIKSSDAKKVVDAKGLYVTPGLIDIHAHVFFGTEPNGYLSNSYTAIPPDVLAFRSGVTTMVDVGGAGWRNFRQFKEQTIDHSKTRVLSMLNIVGAGMKGGHMEQNVNDMDPKMTAIVAKQFPGTIVGVKLAHYSGPEWEPTIRAVEAGKMADIPVMIDFGSATPELALDKLLLEYLRPGDIFTHAFAQVKGRTALIDENGKLRPYVFDAQKKGIIFDVGHGGGSFVFRQAIPALKQGFQPNSISTDIHTGSMNAGMKDMLNIMSKFLNMNMGLQKVMEISTWNPAQIIKRTDLGHLSEGVVADIAIFRLQQGDFGFLDSEGSKLKGTLKLETEMTIREGQIVWDLNGLAGTVWNAGK